MKILLCGVCTSLIPTFYGSFWSETLFNTCRTLFIARTHEHPGDDELMTARKSMDQRLLSMKCMGWMMTSHFKDFVNLIIFTSSLDRCIYSDSSAPVLRNKRQWNYSWSCILFILSARSHESPVILVTICSQCFMCIVILVFIFPSK